MTRSIISCQNVILGEQIPIAKVRTQYSLKMTQNEFGVRATRLCVDVDIKEGQNCLKKLFIVGTQLYQELTLSIAMHLEEHILISMV